MSKNGLRSIKVKLETVNDRLAIFSGGPQGEWRILSIEAIRGQGLSPVDPIAICNSLETAPADSRWSLLGIASHVRYLERREKIELAAIEENLGRAEATRAALIPIRKNSEWWKLTQEERRAVFEEKSHHIQEGLKYLPAVARQLYHSRDLREPFDFLTWFEYPPNYSDQFEELVRHLRTTEEWKYVEPEVDIRLSRQ